MYKGQAVDMWMRISKWRYLKCQLKLGNIHMLKAYSSLPYQLKGPGWV